MPSTLERVRDVRSGDSTLTMFIRAGASHAGDPSMNAPDPPNGRLAIFPGSFDPMTNGHVDIILRSAHLFERILVAVLVNQEKKPLFTPEERVAIIREVFSEYPNVEVDTFDGLLVDYARRRRATRHHPRHPRGLRLRVRVPDGADESPSRAVARDGLHDAGRAVHLSELASHQRSVQPRRHGDRAGAAGGRGRG